MGFVAPIATAAGGWGTILNAASAGFSLIQGIQGFRQSSAMAKAEASNNAFNQQVEQQRMNVERTRMQRELAKTAGSQRVAAAASGATLDSFDTLLDDSYEQGLLDIALAEYDSKLNSISMSQRSSVRQAELRSEATSSLIGGIGGAARFGYEAYNSYNRFKVAEAQTKARSSLPR